MAETVHEVFSAGRLFGRVLGHLLWRQQAELHELLVHLKLRRPLPVAEQRAGGRAGDRVLEHPQHGLIDRTLPRRERSIDGIGAGEVGGIVGIGGADVDQHEVSVAAWLIVVVVMEHAGIFPCGDDRLVGHSAAIARELADQFGLQFVFHHARPEHREHATESAVGDRDRPPHKLHLGGVLHRPQLPQQRLETFVAVQRIPGHDAAGHSQVAGFHLGARALVLVGIEVDPLALAHERVQHARKVR